MTSGKWTKWGATVVGLIILSMFAVNCGGGGTTTQFDGETENPPGVQGNVEPQVGSSLPDPVPILGSSAGAPLGTNPEYQAQDAADLITTSPATQGVSSLRGTSDDNAVAEVLWVAVAPRGSTEEEVVAGQASPEFYEGDEVDLWIRYIVKPNYLTISREWYLDAAGLYLIEPSVTHDAEGVYDAIFPFSLPFGSAGVDAVFKGVVAPPKATSVFVLPESADYREVAFTIYETPTLAPINYPEEPDDENDDDAGGCIPEWITVTWQPSTENPTSVYVECEKDLSNVVLEFPNGDHQKFEDLTETTGTFAGVDEHEGDTITRIWVKSGCNASGEGPGYGERFEPVREELGMAQMGFEDLLVNSDYDYNDFLARMRITELRNVNDELVQIMLTVKAVARAAGYDGEWQFNIDAAFPGASVIAIVDQYYVSGERHGPQRIWLSENGASIPIFSPTRMALPNPPDSYATNGIPGTTFVDGDYCEITIILDDPMPQGSYTPIPYEPELRVIQNQYNIWIIPLWKQPGDWLDDNGRPLAFIVPDTYAWALECKPIWQVYPGFNYWIEWINDQELDEQDPIWYDTEPVSNYFDRSLFKPYL